MTPAPNLEPRVAALEANMAELVGGQETIRGLLRDQGRTLLEHGRILASHSERLDGIDVKLLAHDNRFDRIDAKLTDHDAKLDIIVDWIRAQPDP